MFLMGFDTRVVELGLIEHVLGSRIKVLESLLWAHSGMLDRRIGLQSPACDHELQRFRKECWGQGLARTCDNPKYTPYFETYANQISSSQAQAKSTPNP